MIAMHLISFLELIKKKPKTTTEVKSPNDEEKPGVEGEGRAGKKLTT